MQEVLDNIPDNRLQAYIVWLPMLRADSRHWAVERSREFLDKRLTYFWDGDRITGRQWKGTLQIRPLAWDIYFLYGANAEWRRGPSVPEFWMHQLGDIRKAPRLNRKRFEAEAKELLERIE